MSSYLSYETERREIRIVPVNVIELKLNVRTHGWQRNYSDSFKLSFINDTEAYQFIQFFEIEQSEIGSKYIKAELLLYYKDMKYDFRGSFPTSFNPDNQEVEIHYDHFESHDFNEEDKLVLLSQSRHKKLESLGI